MSESHADNPYQAPTTALAHGKQRTPRYRTAPLPSPDMPPGIPFIVGNEAAERFSFYGMKAILAVFMTRYLLDASGQAAFMTEDQAKTYVHYFVSGAYFFALPGSILADWLWGKYRTIFWLSLVYCLGHLALALDETRLGLFVGLALISIGAGGIKPCVSSHVGDQFGKTNEHLLTRVFSWFYFSINLGALVSTALTPWLLDRYGPHWAFGLPGLLMALATLVFWLGRNKFVHIPPGGTSFLRDLLNRESLAAAARLSVIYVFIAVFWSLYDQTGSAWVLQAGDMNLHWLGLDWLPSQIQLINPLLILVLTPLFAYLIYPVINKFYDFTPLRRIGWGMFLAVISFLITGWVEVQISAGHQPSIAWHALAYLVLTSGEILVSITALEFSYTQAPPKLKSFVMALYFLSVSLGNLFTGLANRYNVREDGTRHLEGADYYWFFAGLLFGTTVIYSFVARFYRGQTYLQTEE